MAALSVDVHVRAPCLPVMLRIASWLAWLPQWAKRPLGWCFIRIALIGARYRVGNSARWRPLRPA